jgi:hypothetical protein
MKQQFVITHQYRVLKETEKIDGSWKNEHLSTPCFDENTRRSDVIMCYKSIMIEALTLFLMTDKTEIWGI